MKKSALILLLIIPFWLSAQNLNPYVLAFESTSSISEVKGNLKSALGENGINVIGEYMPASDKNRWIMVFTSDELVSAVRKIGGLTGFAASLRIGITTEGGITKVSYTNPVYWGNAYFRDDFDKVSTNYKTLTAKLEKSMKASGTWSGKTFGSEKGIEAEDLRKYHYMLGMPYFDDTEELAEFDSYEAAEGKIEKSLEKGVPNVKIVYEISMPDKELTLYGFALSGEEGENKFMPIIDIGSPKHTAFLPYEILVMGNEVHMLHGRFRIALSFPDLTMGTFTKIMSTPGNIEDLMKQLVE